MGKQEQADGLKDWQKERVRTMTAAQGLKRQGICYICRDLETGEVFGKQHVLHEDEVYRVVLDSYPINPGHAIVTYKPHREGLTSLDSQEAARIFKAIVSIAKAIEKALHAEKVYLLSMPDGPSCHLVFQLIPRFEGQPMGMQLLRKERRPLKDGADVARRIAAVLGSASGAAAAPNAMSDETKEMDRPPAGEAETEA